MGFKIISKLISRKEILRELINKMTELSGKYCSFG